MNKDMHNTHYSEYLKVKELTNLQHPRSKEYGVEAHDETLFIITHQVYELWFKQIIHELGDVVKTFNKNQIDESDMLKACSRLKRITEIQKLLLQQIDVIETMTPMDFLDFRDYLIPASGFQSHQFRMIENLLGLKDDDRITYNNQPYKNALDPKVIESVKQTETHPTMSGLLEKWLERTPFIESKGFSFWQEYKLAVEQMQKGEELKVKTAEMSDAVRKSYMERIDLTRRTFQSLFNETEFEKMKADGVWKMSHQAIKAALFIFLYRDEPILQQPFQFITYLQQVDENFTSWRYRHAMMVHRMLGLKMGTGGSSGHKYLMSAADKHKVFSDFVNLATFFIPKSLLPTLPETIQKKLRFSQN